MNPSQGEGEGESQLPDIIMSQEELNKKMEEGVKKGRKVKKVKKARKEKVKNLERRKGRQRGRR